MEVTERMNKTILECARNMRIHDGLPRQFWANTINTTVYLTNRGLSVAPNCGIAKEAWTDKEVNLNHLCAFSCISYVHVDLDHKRKLDSKSKRYIFNGYGTSEYDCRFWDPEN